MNLFQRILENPLVEAEHQRRILLGFQLILIYLFIDFFFFIVNLFNPYGQPYTLLAGAIISGGCLVLLKMRWIKTAMVVHLIRCNVLAFYFSSVDEEPLTTATYLFFIPASLGAIAVFGYKDRGLGIGFTLLSFILFLIALFKPSEFSPDKAHFYMVMNYSFALSIGVLVLLFFDRLVGESEKKARLKNEELTKANLELDRFVYSASHDLRAPLTSISGLVTLAEMDPTSTARYLDMIKTRIAAMEKFIQEIIDYSRNSRVDVDHEPFQIKDIVDEVIESLLYSENAQRIKFEVVIEMEGLVQSDPARLKVIIGNLLTNAIKYQDFTKEDSYVRISARQADHQLNLEVADNGIGIESFHHPHIYDMFYRASDRSQGSGLGLYIVKEVLDKLHGTIQLESEFSKGTSFRIQIPLDPIRTTADTRELVSSN